jgi:lysophospholipase L1-like esterase
MLEDTKRAEEMKEILCYGDSNTWGFDPVTQGRFSPAERWTGVLAHELGPDFRVIEEGLSGRTTVWDDPIEGIHKNGRTYLLPCLESHQPLDLVILMLGTNDLKKRFSVSAFDIAASAGQLVGIVQHSRSGIEGRTPKVLLIAPPPVGRLSIYAEMFEDALGKSSKFSEYYRLVALEYGCVFMDAGEFIRSSEIDGIHFEAGQHERLGQAVAGKVLGILLDWPPG